MSRIDAPLGQTTLIAHDAHGRPLRVQSPSGAVSKYEYDGANLVRTIDSTANRSVFMTYGAFGLPDHLMPSDGPGTWFDRWYSSPSPGILRPDSMHTRVDGAPGFSRVAYDAQGRVRETGDPENHPTRYFYAAGGLQNTDSVNITGGRTTRFTYDAAGRLASNRDASGNTTRAEYDAINRVVRSIGASSDTTTYGYDALFLRWVRDAKGQTYQFQPNALGWVEILTHPRGDATYAGFDAAGNVVRTTDRQWRVVTATYDALGNLQSRTADNATTTFATDPLGRFIATANSESIDTLYMDVLGRPTQEVSWRAGVRHVVTSTYDARGFRTSVNADGRTASYHYNSLGQLDTLTDISGGRTRFIYNADGLRDTTMLPGLTVRTPGAPTHGTGEITYSNGNVNAAVGSLHTYDAVARLLDRLNKAGTAGREFHYDPLGHLTGFADYTISQSCYRDPVTKERTCNAADKSYSASVTYTYDAVGNRTDNAASTDVGNRLTHFGQAALFYFPTGELRYKYFDDCPAGSDCHQEWAYNSIGQLSASWVAGKGWVTYAYDGWGRRIRRSALDSAVTTRYLYDGDNLILVADQDGANVTHAYTSRPGIDQPHSVTMGNATYYFQQDASGNVVGLTSSSGSLVAKYVYDPYGRVIDSTGSVPQHLRFKGRETDPQTGFVYMRARWYDPAIGRFISEDPIGLEGGINVYSFGGNDPVNNADPSGLTCIRTTTDILENTYSGGVLISSVKIGELVTYSADCYGGGPGPGGPTLGPAPRKTKGGAHTEQRILKCVGALANLGLDLAADAAFISGYGVGARLALEAGAGLGAVAVKGLERGMAGAFSARFLYGDNPGRTLSLGRRAARGGAFSTTISTYNEMMNGSGDAWSFLKGFLPFVTTFTSDGTVATAMKACSP